MSSPVGDSKTATYRIGAVARLTGIAPDTLRVWERRYGVVEPGRAAGRFRLYTKEDIRRLALIKQLVDAGNAIGSVASLSLAQLEERLETYSSRGVGVGVVREKPCTVAVLGDALPVLMAAQTEEMRGLELVGVYRDQEQFESEVAAHQPEVIVIEYPTVDSRTVTEVNRLLQRSGAKRAVVVYGFGRQETVRRLDTARLTPMRAPVNLSELKRACLGVLGEGAVPTAGVVPSTGLLPPRRYDNETLGKIAVAATTIKCECPHHLSDLIMNLTAFEVYCEQCESSSREDAALHAHLHSTTAQARAMLEEALAAVVEAEKIRV